MPRLVHLAFAVFTVVPFYLAVQEKFDRHIAFLSSVFLAFFSYHVWSSSLTLTEPIYIFFLISALYFIILYRKRRAAGRDAAGYFTLAVICVAMAELLRYEGWMMAAALTVWMFARNTGKKALAVWVPLISLVPVVLMVASHSITGDALWGLSASDKEVSAQAEKFNDVAVFHVVPPLPLLICFFIGAYLSIKQRSKGAYWLLIFLPPYAFELFKVCTGTLQANPRYFLIYAIFGAPIVVLGLSALIKNRTWRTALVTSFCLLVFGLNSYHILYDGSSHPTYRQGFKDLITWSQANLHGKCIYLSRTGTGQRDVAYLDYTGFNELSWGDTSKSGVIVPVMRRYSDSGNLLYANFDSALSIRHAEYLVLLKNSKLEKSLAFKDSTEHLQHHQFNRVFAEDSFLVYKVEAQSIP
jgi:hypothetical protein